MSKLTPERRREIEPLTANDRQDMAVKARLAFSDSDASHWRQYYMRDVPRLLAALDEESKWVEALTKKLDEQTQKLYPEEPQHCPGCHEHKGQYTSECPTGHDESCEAQSNCPGIQPAIDAEGKIDIPKNILCWARYLAPTRDVYACPGDYVDLRKLSQGEEIMGGWPGYFLLLTLIGRPPSIAGAIRILQPAPRVKD